MVGCAGSLLIGSVGLFRLPIHAQTMLASVVEGYDRWSILQEAHVLAPIRGIHQYAISAHISFAMWTTQKAHKTSNSSSHNFSQGGHRDFKFGPHM